MKCKQPHPGFELGSLSLFPTVMIITSEAPQFYPEIANIHISLFPLVHISIFIFMYGFSATFWKIYFRIFNVVNINVYIHIHVCSENIKTGFIFSFNLALPRLSFV